MADIRVRACLAVVQDGQMLLIPHFDNARNVTWYIPGGGVKFLERLEDAAVREFHEETGFEAACDGLLTIYQTIEPHVPWHGLSMVYRGRITGDALKAENHPKYGLKEARWFTIPELSAVKYYPAEAVELALDIPIPPVKRHDSQEK